MPDVKAHSATLQMNSVNDQALAARTAYGQQLIEQHMPGIIDGFLEEAGVAMASDANRRVAERTERQTDARIEPATGGAVLPRSMSAQQIFDKAKANVEEKYKGQNLDKFEITRLAYLERDRLEAQR